MKSASALTPVSLKPMFAGSLVALITPFTKKGRIDRKALESLVEWHIAEGTDGIVCCGTTGEGFSLSSVEKKEITRICIHTAGGRIPILVGTGAPDTKQTIRFTEDAQKMGAHGCLVVTPYYCKPSQRGCLAHFREVAKVGIPLVVYHNPGRTMFWFTVESIRELGEMPGIAALKDSSHDLSFIRSVRSVSKLPILSGDCDLTFEIMQEGGVGAISVIGNVLPRGWKAMIRAAASGQTELARKLALRYLPLCKGHFLESNPQCVKYVLSQMGKCLPILRLPLVMPSAETGRALQRMLMQLALPYTLT